MPCWCRNGWSRCGCVLFSFLYDLADMYVPAGRKCVVQFSHDISEAKGKTIPAQAWAGLKVPGCWGAQISWQSADECVEVVSPTHRPPLHPRKYSWYSFLLEAESTARRLEVCQWKIPIIPSGIEPATFRLVAVRNQLRHCFPPQHIRTKCIFAVIEEIFPCWISSASNWSWSVGRKHWLDMLP
jgi:hypothetical protein